MSKFVFDPEKGTMVPSKEAEVLVGKSDPTELPSEGKSIVEQPQAPNIETDDEPDVIFKKFSDLSIMRIDDKATGKWLCYFSGYALDIKFNIDELKGANATKKIEACLEGIQKLFRKIIFDQVIGE